MNGKNIFLALATASLMAACGGSADTKPAAEENKAATSQPAATDQPAANNEVANTNDPAIAVIENDKVRFKLHSLQPVTPDPSAPGKPAAGKKVYVADISVEYLQGHNVSAAEYMLGSYLQDDKGQKHSLSLGSVKLAMVVSSEQASRDNLSGEAFGRSNPPTGAKMRGTQYGAELDEATKPVKWSITLDGKEVIVNL